MKLIKNFLWNAGYQAFVLLVPLITIPYISRVLGPTGVGINSFTNSVVQYFILFGSLGINTYGNREVAYKRDSKEELSRTFWEVSFLRFVTIGISVILYLIFIAITNQYQMYYLIQGISLIGAAFDISWFFMGMENFKVTVLRNAFVKILSLVLIFTLVKNNEDIGIYIFILAASQLVGYLTLWPYIKAEVSKVDFRSLKITKHIKPSISLLIPQIATQIYLQVNKTMLGSFRGVEASGFYDNSDKIVKMLLALITATGTVLLPHVAHSFAKGDHAAVKNSLITSLHVILVLACPLAFGLSAVARPFTLLFFGSKFEAVGSLMSVESVVIILIAISSAIGTQYLLPTNQLNAFTTSVIIGSFVNIALNVPLILMFGTMGAIVATVVSETAVSAYQIIRVRNQVSVHSLFEETWKYLLSSLIMYLVLKALSQGLPIGFVGILIEVCVGIVVYFATLMVLQPRVLFGYITELRNDHL